MYFISRIYRFDSKLFEFIQKLDTSTRGLIGLFETSKFDTNLKTLENLYHEFVLTRGDFDERIFLNNQADEQIGTPVKGGANFTPVKVGCPQRISKNGPKPKKRMPR